jgi:non-ribosomal peptide synthase protein (TIGR01720 family)
VQSLPAPQTACLLGPSPGQEGIRPIEVLVACLVIALRDSFQTQYVRLDIESHGRNALSQLDVSRTVGWFTACYPIQFANLQDMSWHDLLRLVKKKLQSLPHHGCSYGLLRYGVGQRKGCRQLHALGNSEIVFNYLGQAEIGGLARPLFSFSQLSVGPSRGGSNARPYLLEVEATVLRGSLVTSWCYSRELHRRATVEGLAHAFFHQLCSVLGDRQATEVLRPSPSDFPLVDLDRDKLAQIRAKVAANND